MSDADTLPEFVKSYSEGFFGLKMKSDVVPCKIAIKDTPIKTDVLALQYMVSSNGKYLSHEMNWLASRTDIQRGYPDLGCVKIGPTMGYLSVRPFRQFKKGYVPANAVIYVPNQSQIRKVMPRFIASTASKEVIWQVFNREYWELARALELMEEGEGVGYPLSQNFGVYLHSEHVNPLIICKNHDAGVVKGERVELFKNFSHLREQLLRETELEAK